MRTLLLCSALSLSLITGCDLFKNDGRLSLQLTDAPYTDAEKVVITIDRVRLQARDGGHENFDLNPPRSVDLLQLSNGATQQLLDSEPLPSGDYDSIRLELIDDSSGQSNYVQLKEGGIRALDVADKELDLQTDFSIDDKGTTALTLDVDLRRSLRDSDNGDYRLVPQLRLVEDDKTGTVSGAVSASRVGSGCVAAVYVYQGKVRPDDIGGTGAQPYSSTAIVADGSGGYRYTAAFLPEGSYTVAFTCDADQDNPEDNDSLDFTDEQVDVRKGRTATQNF